VKLLGDAFGLIALLSAMGYVLSSGQMSLTSRSRASAMALRRRYDLIMPSIVACIAWRDTPTLRPISAQLVPLRTISARICLGLGTFFMLKFIDMVILYTEMYILSRRIHIHG